MQTRDEKFHDPRTGGRWVKKRKAPEAYVVRLIQHGGRVHFGIPRKISEAVGWQRGELVMVSINGAELVIERLRVKTDVDLGGAECDTRKSL